MSNYTSLAFNEFPGAYASNERMYSHRASENTSDGSQISQRYYQSSSSLASALTPVVSKIDESKVYMWPKPSSDGTNSQAQFPELPVNDKGWCDQRRRHGQTISRSTSVMPNRHMHDWNSANSLQGDDRGDHPSLDYDAGHRHAITPAPQDMYQFQQQQVPINKPRDPLYHTRPGILPHTSSSASKLSASPTSLQSPFLYYTGPSLKRLYSEDATNDNAPLSATPTDVASSGYAIAEQLTPAAGQPSLPPKFLYVSVDNLEDEPTIRCPYKWCKSTFTRSNDLARHLATASMHREPVPADPSKRCRLCGEEFSRSDARNRHEIKRSCGKKRTRRVAAV
ncbi:hypothetical protein H2248_004573 [Termitomyces sp. 'cryptogamus']|nr:hypothetical protein H2248_004573 [Termitomyces sp. 'cryptogamus']